MVVEQPRESPKRMRYDARRRVFYATDVPSLLYKTDFPGVYGWVEGLGHPPDSHCDIFLLSELSFWPGDVTEAHVCGVLVRNDHDHKIVALDSAWVSKLLTCDLDSLPDDLRDAMTKVYPVLREGERWAGAAEAWELLEAIRTKRFVPNAD